MTMAAEEKREKKRAKWRKWYARNRDKVLTRRREKRESPGGKLKDEQYRENNHEKLKEIQVAYRETLHGRLMVSLSKCRHRKGKVCEITYNDLAELWRTQDGKCAITNIPMTCDSHYTNISVDRILSDEGYVKNNVRLVCWWVNMARNTLGDDEFLAKCEAVVAYQH